MKDIRVLVIADDLTGALDTGVQFRKWGLPVQVLLSQETLEDTDSIKTTDAVVFNTESRDDPPEVAKKKIQQLLRGFDFSGNCLFYKKIDSTLRGNIGFELDELMKEVGVNYCFLAPAYPEQNRTTLNGVHLVNGVKISETEYFTETRLESSKITNLIETQTSRSTHHVNLKTIRKGAENLKEFVDRLISRGVEIISFDAVTQQDLLAVASISDGLKILCGSAGLASQVPEGLALAKTKPVLTICGSTRTISLKQIIGLTKKSSVRYLSLNTLKILENTFERDKELHRIALATIEYLKKGWDTAISSVSDANSFNQTVVYGKKLGISADEIKKAVSESLSMIVSKIFSLSEVSGLILTGGETALAIYNAIGVKRVELIGEFQPGIPLLKLPSGAYSITKAGGFGTENTLIEAVNFLKRRSSWRNQ